MVAAGWEIVKKLLRWILQLSKKFRINLREKSNLSKRILNESTCIWFVYDSFIKRILNEYTNQNLQTQILFV